jgi:Ca2+-binding RTX toxin-like protein
MAGGSGNDTYYIDDAADTVTEYAGEGRDRAVASIDYQLRAYTEELELSGSANLRCWGNADNNLMIGNSGDNRLYGRDGDDRLEGGAGNDLSMARMAMTR